MALRLGMVAVDEIINPAPSKTSADSLGFGGTCEANWLEIETHFFSLLGTLTHRDPGSLLLLLSTPQGSGTWIFMGRMFHNLPNPICLHLSPV